MLITTNIQDPAPKKVLEQLPELARPVAGLMIDKTRMGSTSNEGTMMDALWTTSRETMMLTRHGNTLLLGATLMTVGGMLATKVQRTLLRADAMISNTTQWKMHGGDMREEMTPRSMLVCIDLKEDHDRSTSDSGWRTSNFFTCLDKLGCGYFF